MEDVILMSKSENVKYPVDEVCMYDSPDILTELLDTNVDDEGSCCDSEIE